MSIADAAAVPVPRSARVPLTSTAAVPWYVWCTVAAVTSAMAGTHWDIAWHRSIGRDTFWTPAHIAIYLCGVLAGISCGYLILSTTFRGTVDSRDASVKLWGFRGPLGAFVAAWGGIAMLTSAPFDDWWHNAYGLDVKVLSPPHVVLITGMIAVELGALILILGSMNRASGALRRKLDGMYLYVAAMILVCLFILVFEFVFRSYMHGARFYRVVAMVTPVVLAGVSRASGKRWAATTVAAIYSAFLLAMLWVLPLIPAEPKLGPVYRVVTNLIPAEFPLLLIVPAFALDLLSPRIRRWNLWLQAAAAGLLFLAVFLAAQWPFASFLLSPGARNRFFGAIYFDYNIPPTSNYVRYVFTVTERTAQEFRTEVALAIAAAILSTRIGLTWGEWMQKVRR
jgi:hypothetical protein